MKRAKIKRKKEYIPDKSQQRKIMAASYMVLAETFIYMHCEYGWEKRDAMISSMHTGTLWLTYTKPA